VRGVPGARRVDHVALTVPDLNVAIRFLVDVLGGEVIYRLPPLARDDDWMRRKLDVHPRAIAEIALVGLGPATNLELFQYQAPGQSVAPPCPCDVGSSHLGLFVDDVETAAASLRDRHGLQAFGPVRTVDAGAPDAGTRWVRLIAPWGMPIELRSVPPHLPYERQTSARRYGPCQNWSIANRPLFTPPLAGLRNVDHLAYTVADLDVAVTFCTVTLGAELLYQAEADLADPALAAAFGVPAKGTVAKAALRIGPTDNIELSCFSEASASGAPPRNSDVGGRHLAIYVDDVDAAAAYLGSKTGCTSLGAPETITEGPIAGDRWVYVRTPLGLHIELVNMPDGTLPYEQGTSARRRPAGGLRWQDR
jgi:2-epi-5-epi-valiolone epimerase